MSEYATSELMASIMAHHLQDGEVAVMGAVSMVPMAACRLAQETHAPNLTWIAGGSGAVNPRLYPLVPSSCDYDLLRSDCALPLPDVILLEGRGAFDVFFAGGLQIDQFGNCNLVCVGDWEKPALRGPGTVGLPFLPRARRVVIYTQAHNRRTFVPKVDFLSGPGFLSGGEELASYGVPGKGPALVVTPLATMDFEPESKRMRLKTVHPGVTVEQVRDNTGFDLIIPDRVPESAPPTEEELAILRAIDPAGIVRGLG